MPIYYIKNVIPGADLYQKRHHPSSKEKHGARRRINSAVVEGKSSLTRGVEKIKWSMEEKHDTRRRIISAAVEGKSSLEGRSTSMKAAINVGDYRVRAGAT